MLFFIFLVIGCRSCASYNGGNPAFYCDSIILWPVASDIQANAWELNKEAYQLYYAVKTKYLNESDPFAPTLACLAVAREFFCAYKFPYCKDDINYPHNGVCTNLCNIYKKRCPYEEFDLYCSNSPSSFCSFGSIIIISLVSLLLF